MRLPTLPSTRSPLQQRPKSQLSLFVQWGAGQVRPLTSPANVKVDGETRFPMVPRIAKWVSLTALVLMVALWKPTSRFSEPRSEEHTTELHSRPHLVCRLLLGKQYQ